MSWGSAVLIGLLGIVITITYIYYSNRNKEKASFSNNLGNWFEQFNNILMFGMIWWFTILGINIALNILSFQDNTQTSIINLVTTVSNFLTVIFYFMSFLLILWFLIGSIALFWSGMKKMFKSGRL